VEEVWLDRKNMERRRKGRNRRRAEEGETGSEDLLQESSLHTQW